MIFLCDSDMTDILPVWNSYIACLFSTLELCISLGKLNTITCRCHCIYPNVMFLLNPVEKTKKFSS